MYFAIHPPIYFRLDLIALLQKTHCVNILGYMCLPFCINFISALPGFGLVLVIFSIMMLPRWGFDYLPSTIAISSSVKLYKA